MKTRIENVDTNRDYYLEVEKGTETVVIAGASMQATARRFAVHLSASEAHALSDALKAAAGMLERERT